MTPEMSAFLEPLLELILIVVTTIGGTDAFKLLAGRVEALHPLARGVGARAVSWAIGALAVLALAGLGLIEPGSASEWWAAGVLVSNWVYTRVYAPTSGTGVW